MDFRPTAAEERLGAQAARFSDAELVPRAAEFERDEAIPLTVFEELASHGLMGVHVPEALGGSGLSPVAYSLAMMEIARGCASTAVTMAVTNMVAEVITQYGSDAQRSRYVSALCAGKLGAFALSESGAGSDPVGMRTTARREGDHWILNGSKQWISHGDLSEVLVVWARTGGEGSRGISCFLVEPTMDGFSVTGREDKMGLRASHTVGLAFDELKLPADALLGAQGSGFSIAMTALDGGRIGVGSQAIGIAEAAYRAMVDHLGDRRDDDRVHRAVADTRTELDAARLLIWQAAWLKGDGERFTRQASSAKLFATEAAWRACLCALDQIGPSALRADHPVQRHLRDVRVTRIYEGTSQIQRLVVARGALAAPVP